MSNVRILKTYLLILEFTSIPLAILLLLYILSGYGMINSVFENLGLNYRVSSLIHTSRTLRILLVSLTYLHLVSGFETMIYKYVRHVKIRLLLEITLYVAVIVTLTPIVISEANIR